MRKRLIVPCVLGALLVSCASVKAPEMHAISSSDERMVSYSARIYYEVKDIPSTKRSVSDACRELGGFITTERNDYLFIRVPLEHYGDFIEIIERIHKIKKSEMIGEDITDAYEDIMLQLESKLKLRDRYTLLLSKAEGVEDLLSIERELERVNLDIQSLEGRKTQAEKKVAYVSLRIYFEQRITPGPLGWIFYLLYRSVKWLFVW